MLEPKPKAKTRKTNTIYIERIVDRDDGEGNWLISYADMMTLLFGFFVIMSALSTPDAGKVEKLKKATAKSMGVEYVNPYEDLTRQLQEILETSRLSEEVKISETDEGITIVSRGTVFFDSGETTLKPIAKTLLTEIGKILVERARGYRVQVEGHTDNIPILSSKFPSNWELSASRASAVVRLLEDLGFSHTNLRPIGLADTEPVAPNRDASGRPSLTNQAINRRIVIRILKQIHPKSKTT